MVRTITQRAEKPVGRAAVDDEIAQLHLDGPLGSRTAELMSEFMRKVGELLHEDLRPQKNVKDWKVGHWRLNLDLSGMPTGRVDVRFSSVIGP